MQVSGASSSCSSENWILRFIVRFSFDGRASAAQSALRLFWYVVDAANSQPAQLGLQRSALQPQSRRGSSTSRQLASSLSQDLHDVRALNRFSVRLTLASVGCSVWGAAAHRLLPDV